MIKTLGQVMLYVDHQEEAVEFWTKDLGFIVKSKVELFNDYYSVEVAPGVNSETSLVIFDKAFIRKYSDVSNLEIPSLMFRTDNIEALYEDFKNKGITVGEKVERAADTVFNFADNEGNYFAVSD